MCDISPSESKQFRVVGFEGVDAATSCPISGKSSRLVVTARSRGLLALGGDLPSEQIREHFTKTRHCRRESRPAGWIGVDSIRFIRATVVRVFRIV
jgi:hypothetical protein